MRILFVTSECSSLFKRGGLGDVSHSLPAALARLGVNISVVMPYYEKVKPDKVHCVGQLALDYDRRRELVFIFRSVIPGSEVPIYLFRHPRLNNYEGEDIAQTFAFFSKAVAMLYLYAPGTLGGPYDIIHCHDWHTALIPLILGENRKVAGRDNSTVQSESVKTVLTIHNLLYQGETGVSIILKLGLSKSVFHIFTTPLGRAVKFLREGLEHADIITTVSPTYAKEINENIYGGLIGEVLARRADRVVGILNGIDSKVWNPRNDPFLWVNYGKRDAVAAKKEIKRRLQRALWLPEKDILLFGFVSRLEPAQKGIDLILKTVKRLPADAFQLVILGMGCNKNVALIERLAKSSPNMAFVHTFDERFARRIYAGSDVILIPSRFEPCGLTQLIAMRYGALPLVRATGGLKDTVDDGVNGFVFKDYSVSDFQKALIRAIELWQEKPAVWQKMIKKAMTKDYSWRKSAKEYLRVYKSL